ncbi:MAG: fasciclin domain-containing protein [Gammaproteobacteria bacterium]
MPATANIIETAVNAGNFSTLADAIESAGLAETLNGAGPFTVFAPSDEAFEKIPEKIRAAIIADKDALTELLTYHVVSGEVTAADVAKLDSATTVQGSSISFDTSIGVKVDGANVVAADIRATNGIIHVIDTVMVPN